MRRFRCFAVSTLMALALIGPALFAPGPSVAQLERLINVAFDTRDVRRLEVRVYDEPNSLAQYENYC